MGTLDLYKIVLKAFNNLREFISLDSIIQIKDKQRNNEGKVVYFYSRSGELSNDGDGFVYSTTYLKQSQQPNIFICGLDMFTWFKGRLRDNFIDNAFEDGIYIYNFYDCCDGDYNDVAKITTLEEFKKYLCEDMNVLEYGISLKELLGDDAKFQIPLNKKIRIYASVEDAMSTSEQYVYLDKDKFVGVINSWRKQDDNYIKENEQQIIDSMLKSIADEKDYNIDAGGYNMFSEIVEFYEEEGCYYFKSKLHNKEYEVNVAWDNVLEIC